MRAHIFAAVCFLLMSGCDFGDGNCSVTSEEHKEENVESRPERITERGGRLQESITITDVILRESEGGYYTDNRFMCNVCSREDWELWLEVCDSVDGHRFSEIKDERTRRKVSENQHGSNFAYNVKIDVDGDGQRVKSVVSLWGKPISGGDAIVLFKTNAVLGTWKGR